MARSSSKSTLITAGIATAVVGLLALLFYQSVWSPYMTLQDEMTKAEGELATKAKEFIEFEAKKKKLEKARLVSFPVNGKNWLTDYENYLRRLARNIKADGSKEKGPQVIAPTSTAEAKLQPQAGKKPEQLVRTWTVKGKGTWASLVGILEGFQRTPLLHRIKTIHVERAAGTSEADKKEKEFVDELSVTITVETLSLRNDKRSDNVWGSDGRVLTADAFAGLGLMEMPAGRKYDRLARYWNPFRGGLTDAQWKEKYAGDFEEPEVPEKSDELLEIVGLDIRQLTRLAMNVHTTKEIRVLVKAEGTSAGTGRFGYPPTVPLDDDDTVSLGRGRAVIVGLQTKNGDHRVDRVEGITPAGQGLTAEITEKGELKLTARKDAVLGSYVVRTKTTRVTLRNLVLEPSKIDASGNLRANPKAYETLSTPSNIWFFVIGETGVEQARGKVLNIDPSGVYFLCKDMTKRNPRLQTYRILNGESVYEALQNPLTSAELQQLDWWALPRLTAGTVGLLSGPGPGPLLAGFALYPDRPGLRGPSESAPPPLDSVGK